MQLAIQTERLLLRSLTEEDAPQLQPIANQPEVLKWMPDWRRSVAEIAELIGTFQQIPADPHGFLRLMLGLEREGQLIGLVGINTKKELNNEREIVYYIQRGAAGHGYMTEAARALTAWAFAHLDLAYLAAIVEPANLPSQRVVEKCGFVRLETRLLVNSGETAPKPFYYYRLAPGAKSATEA